MILFQWCDETRCQQTLARGYGHDHWPAKNECQATDGVFSTSYWLAEGGEQEEQWYCWVAWVRLETFKWWWWVQNLLTDNHLELIRPVETCIERDVLFQSQMFWSWWRDKDTMWPFRGTEFLLLQLTVTSISSFWALMTSAESMFAD